MQSSEYQQSALWLKVFLEQTGFQILSEGVKIDWLVIDGENGEGWTDEEATCKQSQWKGDYTECSWLSE